ncbi:glycosyltransferase family 4 protein [Pasteurella skyensis]|uniref:Glycosyltransferase family 4 protein n=1 Tax=Phocoenobacter skyensis TaxID=97481 RepID=A0AAJ6P2V2_9PAST|nr:glycosyltransferase family 4 protein [Pasteurella skyensis]MDP8170031.1 glycosyltransferase family 4 protein [Pasteurella skyensis]MDP8175098.1 glycosyltransferase family 4 protein [Pasteurella skyensis]
MKILYLSFYFEPDLCAGSFRNTSLAKELSRLSKGEHQIDVITTKPNRYDSFKVDAKNQECVDNMTINRIDLPSHNSGMLDQINAFRAYYSAVRNITKNQQYDLVFASSSRLFTAFLGCRIAKKKNIPLYLDIRDIFVDTMKDVLNNNLLKFITLPILKTIEHYTFSKATHINLISEGFRDYFACYKQVKFSYYTNGIDDVFLNNINQNVNDREKDTLEIIYAGNIGEGQGLHKIIPQVASELGNNYQFKIIGDGGAKSLLLDELNKRNLKNVNVNPPVGRKELIDMYNKADFLFLHLNDYDAFKKVLPSKLFELATFNRPIIAGVGGYAEEFIKKNIPNVILFNPCNVDEMVQKLRLYEYEKKERSVFKKEFNRKNINNKMAESILSYLK